MKKLKHIYYIAFLLIGLISYHNSVAGSPPGPSSKLSCQFYSQQNIPSGIVGINEMKRNNLLMVKVFCKPTIALSIPTTITASFSGFSNCTNNSTDVCILEKSEGMPFNIKASTFSDTGNWIVFKNPKNSIATISPGQIVMTASALPLGQIDTTTNNSNSDGFTIQVDAPGTPLCSIVPSGISAGKGLDSASCKGQNCSPSGSLAISLDKIIFKVSTTNISSIQKVASVSWSGGPDSHSGVLENPTPNSLLTVRAKVTVTDLDGLNSKDAYCAIKLQTTGVGYNIGLSKYGDCYYFAHLKTYYFLDPTNDHEQNSPFHPALGIAGFSAKYGSTRPEIPFGGILNKALKLNGDALVDEGTGRVIIPPENDRSYSEVVIVAYRIDPATFQKGEPLFYGFVDVNNISKTTLHRVPGIEQNPSDKTLVAFSLFLAHTELQDGVDKRGTTGRTPFWVMKDADSSNRPFDKAIPFFNSSCIPIYQIKSPARSDKALPTVLNDSISCILSKPVEFGEFKTSKVKLDALYAAPTSAKHLFPLSLIAADAVKEKMNPPSTTTKDCWVYNPAQLGNVTWARGTPSIIIRDPDDECSLKKSTGDGRVGYRWSMSAMFFGMTFGCAVTQNKPNTPICADLGEHSSGKPGDFSGVVCGGNGGMFSGCSPGYAKSKAPSSQVRTQHFFVRQWGGDDAQAANSEIGNFFADMCPGSQFMYDEVSLSWSPILLDLNGKGISISRKFTQSVGFDIDNSGKIAYIDWPLNTNDVAFLVRPGKRGEIKSMKHLFGDDEKRNGFETLKVYDTNNDGILDKKDKNFSELKLWFDRNRSGKVDKGEVVSLKEKGVEKINLKYLSLGEPESAEGKTLSSTYYNTKLKKDLSIEDHYFYQYVDSKRVEFEKKPD